MLSVNGKNQYVKVVTPLIIGFGLLWLIYKYFAIQELISASTSLHSSQKIERVLINELVISNIGTGSQHDSQSTSWIQALNTESESIWRDSKLKRLATLQKLGPKFREQPWSVHEYTIFWDFFTPSYHCPRPVERVGRVGDGGKWICGFSHLLTRSSASAAGPGAGRPCVVYSFGINQEISFEQEILERSPNCELRMYDYTINITHGPAAELVKRYPTRAKLYKLGLGSSNTEILRTLRTEMELQKHAFIDILKIDIEGSEFTVLSSIIADFPTKLPFAQLQIELHLDSMKSTAAAAPAPANANANIFTQFVTWFEQLENAGLRPFWSELNQIPAIMGSNFNHLPYIEYAFLNVKIDPNYFL